jgi:ABC-type nitrate/sulfonate/bicarbonate transport system ATPase subunit
MIEIKNLSFSYENLPILEDISFSLEAGSLTCLLGRSGLGKTTLLNMIVGLLKPSSGDIVASFNRPGRDVAYLNQNAGLLPWRNAEANIYLAGDLLGISLDKDLIVELVDLMGLRSKLSHYPDQLSGGELQRFALIQRLILSPKLLVLDEPFGAMDIILRRDLSSLIREIVKARGIYALVVTHQPEDALFLAENILILSRVAMEGASEISRRMKKGVDFDDSSSYLKFVEALR